MEQEIANFLLECGFSPKHYGYRYLKKAILYYVNEGMDVRLLGRRVYNFLSISEDCKAIKTIEKNITCAIEWAYLHGDVKFLSKYHLFGDNERGRPTNNEFIALASNCIVYGNKVC